MKLKLTIECEKHGFRRSLEVDSELLVHRKLWKEINELVDAHIPETEPTCPHNWISDECIYCINSRI